LVVNSRKTVLRASTMADSEEESLVRDVAATSLAAPPPPPLSLRPADPPVAAAAAAAPVEVAEAEENPITLNNGEISCAYRELEEIPAWIGERHGPRVTRLDMSCNQLTGQGLATLSLFTGLEELVLDGNDTLADGIVFPGPLAALESLSINKCGVTDVEPLLETIKVLCPSPTSRLAASIDNDGPQWRGPAWLGLA